MWKKTEKKKFEQCSSFRCGLHSCPEFAGVLVLYDSIYVSSYYVAVYMCPHTTLLYICVLILYYTTGYILLYYWICYTRWIYSRWIYVSPCHIPRWIYGSPCHMPFAILTVSQHWKCPIFYLYYCTNVYYILLDILRAEFAGTCHCQTAT